MMNEIKQKSVSSKFDAERNSLPYVFCLPTETLEDIFIQRARDYQSWQGGLPRPTVPNWVNVSYVCSHWRNVALNCATLWTHLFITSPRWTEELLARSKQAPLTVYVNTHYEDNISRSHFVEEVMNRLERIQELRLYLSTISDHQILSKLSSPAPSLKSLEIWMKGSPSEFSSVLYGVTPALRTLALADYPAPWYSTKLSGLTTLTLYRVPLRFRQHTVELLATLRCMQHLKHLYLYSALASAVGFLSSTAFHTFQKFTLPHLSRLLLVAPLSTAVAMLSCVNIPSKTEIKLECEFEQGSSLDDYAALSSLLAQRYNMSVNQAPSSSIIRSFAIDVGRKMMNLWLAFSALERDCVFDAHVPDEEWDCNIPLTLMVGFGESMTTDREERIMIMGDICCSILLTNVQSVHVINPPFCSVFWKKLLGHVPNLRYLKLSSGDMPELPSVLSVTPRDGAENHDRHADQDPWMFAPALDELELNCITFPPPARERDKDTFATDIQSLYDALSTRRESRGQLIMSPFCYEETKCGHTSMGMVGRWEGGHFHVNKLWPC